MTSEEVCVGARDRHASGLSGNWADKEEGHSGMDRDSKMHTLSAICQS